jgi:hypothetical protein
MMLKPLFGWSTDAWRKAIELLGAIPMLLNFLQQEKGVEDNSMYHYKYEINLPLCGAVCATLNELFLENLDRAMSFQIANDGGIKLIVDMIGKYVKPVSSPLTKSINPFPYRFELKDGDILACLAMFAANDGKLPLYYATD